MAAAMHGNPNIAPLLIRKSKAGTIPHIREKYMFPISDPHKTWIENPASWGTVKDTPILYLTFGCSDGILSRMRSLIFFLLLAAANISAAQNVVQPLPNIPVSPLSQKDIDSLAGNDNAEAWKAYSEKARETALDLAAKQLYLEAAGWLYLHEISNIFSKYGAAMDPALKKAILSDMPALCDFIESIKEEDNIEGACKVLSQIYKVYPENFKKYIRSAYAVSLVYDVPPPGGWPACETPSDPVPLSQPEEVFNIFIGDPATFVFPMDKLTVGELIWIFGVGGPLDELRELKNTSMAPFAIEKMIQSIKTDRSRIENGQTKPWNTLERKFTPKNIIKYGGSDFEKVYCAWRVANANGIPCLFFCEKGNGGEPFAWLSYMSRPGVWRFNVARPSEAKCLFGRPLDPQTWKVSQQFDIDMLERRHITTQSGVLSRVFLRVSRMLYEKGKYNDAAIFAEKARKENPENWEAYIAYISARARFGAPQRELDAHWRKSYEAFRRYPDMCIQILNSFRKNLIATRRDKEADRLLTAEMRGVMRADPGLGIDIYSKQIADMFERAEDKSDIFTNYQDIVRNSLSSQEECFKKIVTPLVNLFVEAEDYRSAQRVISMFAVSVKNDSLKAKIDSLKESAIPPKKSKRSKQKDE